MNYAVINDEVLYTTEAVTQVNRDVIEFLKSASLKNPRRRIRLCAHPDTDDSVHEMIIVHARGAYVRPHKHLGKSESFHVIEGRLLVALFEDDGQLRDMIHMGEATSGETFFYRLSESRFHTVIPLSELVVFHEITRGPFRPEETVFPPWAPDTGDLVAQKRHLAAWLAWSAKGF